jgi:hypothetical protein
MGTSLSLGASVSDSIPDFPSFVPLQRKKLLLLKDCLGSMEKTVLCAAVLYYDKVQQAVGKGSRQAKKDSDARQSRPARWR